MSTATRDDVGAPPGTPTRLRAAEWVDIFKRAAKEFVDDDCMGLGVITMIDQAQTDAAANKGGSAIAFVVGLFAAV